MLRSGASRGHSSTRRGWLCCYSRPGSFSNHRAALVGRPRGVAFQCDRRTASPHPARKACPMHTPTLGRVTGFWKGDGCLSGRPHWSLPCPGFSLRREMPPARPTLGHLLHDDGILAIPVRAACHVLKQLPRVEIGSERRSMGDRCHTDRDTRIGSRSSGGATT